jgi:hypothetical protein
MGTNPVIGTYPSERLEQSKSRGPKTSKS